MIYTRRFRHLPVCSQATKVRKQEGVSPTREGGAALLGNGRLTRGNAHAITPKTPARNVPPGLCRVSPDNASGKATMPAHKVKPRVIRLSFPNYVEPFVQTAELKDSTAVGSVPNDSRSTTGNIPHPANAAASPALETTPTSHSPVVSRHATNEGSPDRDERFANADLGTGGEAIRQGAATRSPGGDSDDIFQQKRRTAIDREVDRTLPSILPDTEVLEVSLLLHRYLLCVRTCLFSLVANPTRERKQTHIDTWYAERLIFVLSTMLVRSSLSFQLNA